MLAVKDRAPDGGGKFLAAGSAVDLSRTFRSQCSEETPGAGLRSGYSAVRRPQGQVGRPGYLSRRQACDVRAVPLAPSLHPASINTYDAVSSPLSLEVTYTLFETIHILSCCHLCSATGYPSPQEVGMFTVQGCGTTSPGLSSSCPHPCSAQWFHTFAPDLHSASGPPAEEEPAAAEDRRSHWLFLVSVFVAFP